MQYTHEFELRRGENQWIIEAIDLPGCITQGEDVADACDSAADLLREMAWDKLLKGEELTNGTFGHTPQNGGVLVVVSVEATLDSIQKVSASEAARMLEVGRSRITAMLKSGLLEGWRDGRNTWITLDSINARKKDRRMAGRPKKAAATA